MRPWQFTRPKGPGYGISQGFYLSILCSSSVLPSILSIVNPHNEGGAVDGFGAPLAPSADKGALAFPIQRGAYVIASKDRKTVLRALVLNRQEAGYDPEVFARSSMAADASAELLARIRGTWTIVQLTFSSHDPDVYPALDFLLAVAIKFASLADGVVADPLCRRYRLPDEVYATNRMDPRVDARDHIAIQFIANSKGLYAFTLGMQKFGLPEYEMDGLDDADQALATRFLLAVSQRVLLGDLTKNGERFGAPQLAFEARTGGLNRAMWEGIPVFELIPPTGTAPVLCLQAWSILADQK